MKKLILWGAMAAAAAAVWGADLNPCAGRAEATGNQGNYPWEIDLKRIWSGDPCDDISRVFDAYDNWYWNYTDPQAPNY